MVQVVGLPASFHGFWVLTTELGLHAVFTNIQGPVYVSTASLPAHTEVPRGLAMLDLCELFKMMGLGAKKS